MFFDTSGSIVSAADCAVFLQFIVLQLQIQHKELFAENMEVTSEITTSGSSGFCTVVNYFRLKSEWFVASLPGITTIDHLAKYALLVPPSRIWSPPEHSILSCR
uniref:Secreted protein n=1 Tax=Heterorhabditis bacteriophora TaxID=37862 RepID=A0A1I7WEV3_HETBA